MAVPPPAKITTTMMADDINDVVDRAGRGSRE